MVTTRHGGSGTAQHMLTMANLGTYSYWILKNLVYGDGYVTLQEAFSRYVAEGYSGPDMVTFSKRINELYPETELTQKTGLSPIDGQWKRMRGYQGLIWRKSDRQLEWQEVLETMSHHGFNCTQSGSFTSENSAEWNSTTFSNKREVRICPSGTYKIWIDGLEVDPGDHGFPSEVHVTEAGCNAICTLIKKMVLCEGIENGEVSGKMKKEQLQIGANQKSVLRATTCSRVVPPTSLSNTCKECIAKAKNARRYQKGKLRKTETPICENPHHVEAKVKPEVTSDIPSNSESGVEGKELNDDKTYQILKSIEELDIPEVSKIFLKDQIINLHRAPTGRRWSRDVVIKCLELYCRAPTPYNNLISSKMLVLPSPRVLRRYKNLVDQKPGLNKDLLAWMKETASSNNVPLHGLSGGIIFDEMTIQPDLQVDTRGGNNTWVGLATLGEEGDDIETIIQGGDTTKLATHTLLLEFHGYTGFVFPFAHYPTCGVKGSQLTAIMHESLKQLMEIGFTPEYFMYDGASSNRAFLNAHFSGDPVNDNMTTVNIFDVNRTITHFPDPKHVIKRLRNMVLQSGKSQGSNRLLLIDGLTVEWDHWEKAYEWDLNNNPEMRRIHHRLTEEHIYLTEGNKMRNHLAEESLSGEMLFLMKAYADSLPESCPLSSSIKFLDNTSFIVDLFNNTNPLTSLNDDRITKATEVLKFFNEWKVTNKKSMMTKETQDDTKYLLSAFLYLSRKLLSRGQTVHPAQLNSDIIENFFCQQRGLNGSNSNPTYLQFTKTCNSIILGASSRESSKRSNTQSASPFNWKAPRKF